MQENYFFPIIFFPTILIDAPIDKLQKCHFILRSEFIWGMLKSNKDVHNLAVTATLHIMAFSVPKLY